MAYTPEELRGLKESDPECYAAFNTAAKAYNKGPGYGGIVMDGPVAFYVCYDVPDFQFNPDDVAQRAKELSMA